VRIPALHPSTQVKSNVPQIGWKNNNKNIDVNPMDQAR
jgi:hypothetical protein